MDPSITNSFKRLSLRLKIVGLFLSPFFFIFYNIPCNLPRVLHKLFAVLENQFFIWCHFVNHTQFISERIKNMYNNFEEK